MIAINTIPEAEYAERLFKAMQRMSKKISKLSEEEDALMAQSDNKGDEERSLRHAFNSIALFWASQAIIISPGRLKERLAEINRREFTPTINGDNYSRLK